MQEIATNDQKNIKSTTWTATFKIANKDSIELRSPAARGPGVSAALSIKASQMYGGYPLTKESSSAMHRKITVYSQPCPHTQVLARVSIRRTDLDYWLPKQHCQCPKRQGPQAIIASGPLEHPNPKELEPVWGDEGKFNRVREVLTAS